MFKKLKLSAKITILSAALLAVTVTLGAIAVGNMLPANQRVQVISEELMPAIDSTVNALFEMLEGHLENLSKSEKEIIIEKEDAISAAVERTIRYSEVTSRLLNVGKLAILIGLVVAFGLGLFLSIFITNSIVRPINAAIDDLSSGSGQVSTAAAEIASSSHGLASGATEQAASLEEISSALNEITSMTKQTADNAKNADGLVRESVEKANGSKDAMNRLQDAVSEIQNSSNETAKILKDIDEIAFQTNLLALNAAVEAARAGEAGKGFAVVAEEVRNLAQRSAESAKKTAELIQGSQASSARGVDLAHETADAIDAITESSNKIAMIVAEITTAAEEQAQGVSQLNIAISDMDQVTQGNASASEELAASSEELGSQAAVMDDSVGNLFGILAGEKAKIARAQQRGLTGAAPSKKSPKVQKPLAIAYQSKPAPKPASAPSKSVATPPPAAGESLIPFDDDFGDY